MKKRKVPQPEPANLTLEYPELEPDKPKFKKIDPLEQAKLEAIKKNGGLLRERWVWKNGRAVFDSYVID